MKPYHMNVSYGHIWPYKIIKFVGVGGRNASNNTGNNTGNNMGTDIKYISLIDHFLKSSFIKGNLKKHPI